MPRSTQGWSCSDQLRWRASKEPRRDAEEHAAVLLRRSVPSWWLQRSLGGMPRSTLAHSAVPSSNAASFKGASAGCRGAQRVPAAVDLVVRGFKGASAGCRGAPELGGAKPSRLRASKEPRRDAEEHPFISSRALTAPPPLQRSLGGMPRSTQPTLHEHVLVGRLQRSLGGMPRSTSRWAGSPRVMEALQRSLGGMPRSTTAPAAASRRISRLQRSLGGMPRSTGPASRGSQRPRPRFKGASAGCRGALECDTGAVRCGRVASKEPRRDAEEHWCGA